MADEQTDEKPGDATGEAAVPEGGAHPPPPAPSTGPGADGVVAGGPDGDPEVEGDDPDDGAGDRRSGVLGALTPRGPWEIALAVVAVCFLAGAVGYLVGSRQAPVATSAVDQGFLFDMSDHHDQAIGMALCAVNKAQDPVVQSMAREILVFQDRELARMGSLLELMRVERPVTEGRTAMAWMGMPTPVEAMPGMASPADYDALCSASATDVDRRFLTLMRAHHQGGVHMSEAAARDAANPSVRSLAATMARNQAIEVNEYTAVMKRLGYEK